jgi:hypothetical protein
MSPGVWKDRPRHDDGAREQGQGLMVLVFEDLLGVAFRSALDRS